MTKRTKKFAMSPDDCHSVRVTMPMIGWKSKALSKRNTNRMTVTPALFHTHKHTNTRAHTHTHTHTHTQLYIEYTDAGLVTRGI